jgi:hypothetical protein
MSASFSRDDFIDEIKSIASSSRGSNVTPHSREVAEALDKDDSLGPLRSEFILPTMRDANVVDAAGESGKQR